LNTYEAYYQEVTENEEMTLQYHCLYYDVIDNIAADEDYIWANQLMTFCFRPLDQNATVFPHDLGAQTLTEGKYRFAELEGKNISSSQLLDWSAPIDIVEAYQAYLDNGNRDPDIRMSTTNTERLIFHNCTPPYFGPHCQYVYVYGTEGESLEFYIELTYNYLYVSHPPEPSYYAHLSCTHLHSGLHLDWREVCDGKHDCEGGEDENDEHCWQLQANQCGGDEFRCQNGQCIPLGFRNDDPSHPDCMDRSDESSLVTYPSECIKDIGFRCEESTCASTRGLPVPFSCGDGECIDQSGKCSNKRRFHQEIESFFHRSTYIRSKCRQIMTCLTGLAVESDAYECEWGSSEGYIVESMDSCSWDPFIFPPWPVLFGHVYLAYSALMFNEGTESISPRFVCFNTKLCRMKNATVLHVEDETCVFL
jgi:hypothetical protein